MKQKAVVIGLGYVGFPLACAIVKSRKYNVVGIEIDKQKLDLIDQRISPIEDHQAQEDIKAITLKATDDFSEIKGASFIIICVPTPVSHEKEPDLTPLLNAARQVSNHLTRGQTVIIESTINPGVCEEDVLPILEQSGLIGGIDFELVHCPERIDPANTSWNVYNIPRNIGGITRQGTKQAANFYRSFLKGEITELSCLKSAEATKIVENTFRDINIAYVNELAKSFDYLGIDILEVIKGASTKPFAYMAHYPGCGVGGHCIPVDPYYLIAKAKKARFDHTFLKTARKINNSMNRYTVEKLIVGLNELGKSVKHTKIGILGISYKANIGDLRESPSLEIIKILNKYEPDLLLCDPYVKNGHVKELQALIAGSHLVDMETVLTQSEAIMVLTSHDEFLQIKDWSQVQLIVDGRNCLDKEEIKKQGIIYKGIGRT